MPASGQSNDHPPFLQTHVGRTDVEVQMAVQAKAYGVVRRRRVTKLTVIAVLHGSISVN
jgi:hypothetical protein